MEPDHDKILNYLIWVVVFIYSSILIGLIFPPIRYGIFLTDMCVSVIAIIVIAIEVVFIELEYRRDVNAIWQEGQKIIEEWKKRCEIIMERRLKGQTPWYPLIEEVYDRLRAPGRQANQKTLEGF